MILYADTSALVKRYVREAGSEAVLAYFVGFETTATAGGRSLIQRDRTHFCGGGCEIRAWSVWKLSLIHI